jgi:hypothetical protein
MLDDKDTYISVEQAEKRRESLASQVQDLQAQLGDKQKTDQHGRRMSSKDYWAWRQAAQQSINAKLSEIRAIKAWLRAHGRREQAEPSIQHLTNLFLLVDQLIKEDAVELNQAEHALVQNAGEHLRQLGAIS